MVTKVAKKLSPGTLAKNRERVRVWRREHPQEQAAQKKRYVEKHREAVRTRWREYAKSDQPGAIRGRIRRALKAKQKHKSTMYTRMRRAARKGAAEIVLTLEQWEAVKRVYRNKCAYCGREAKLTLDHVVALTRGGNHTVQNAVPACLSCNASKGVREPLIPLRILLL